MCGHVCRPPRFHLGSCLPGSGPWSTVRGILTVSTAGHAVCRPRVKAGAGPWPGDCGHCFTDRPPGGQHGTELGAGPAPGPSYWGKTLHPSSCSRLGPLLGGGELKGQHRGQMLGGEGAASSESDTHTSCESQARLLWHWGLLPAPQSRLWEDVRSWGHIP